MTRFVCTASSHTNDRLRICGSTLELGSSEWRWTSSICCILCVLPTAGTYYRSPPHGDSNRWVLLGWNKIKMKNDFPIFKSSSTMRLTLDRDLLRDFYAVRLFLFFITSRPVGMCQNFYFVYTYIYLRLGKVCFPHSLSLIDKYPRRKSPLTI